MKVKGLWQIFDTIDDAKNELKKWELQGTKSEIRQMRYKGKYVWGIYLKKEKTVNNLLVSILR